MTNPYAVTAPLAAKLSTPDLQATIADLQKVQAVHGWTGPTAHMSEDASLQLEPLFAEMARRQKAGLL